MVESWFPREMNYRQRENQIDEFSAMGDGILAMMDIEDIIRNAPRE